MWSRQGVVLGILALLNALSACGDSESGDGGDGDKGGSSGSAGATGTGGSSAGAMNGGTAGRSNGGASGTGAGRGGTGMGGDAGTSAGDGGAGDGGAGDGGAGDGGDAGDAGSGMGGAGGGMGGAGAGMGGAGAGMGGAGAGMGGAGAGMGGAGAGMGGAGMGGAGMGGAGAGMGGAGMGGAGMAGSGGVGPVLNLFFSEYYEGTATPQESAVEIYNAGMAAANLTQCSVRVYPNGMGNFTAINLITTLAPGQVHVVCSAQSVSGNCDQSNSTLGQVTGNDAVAIVCNGAFQDIIGQIGNDPTNGEWGTGNTSTADNTIRRSCTVTTGDRNGNDTFTLPATQWTGLTATKTDLGTRVCIN